MSSGGAYTPASGEYAIHVGTHRIQRDVCAIRAAGHIQLRLGSLQPGWFGEFSPLTMFSDQSA